MFEKHDLIFRSQGPQGNACLITLPRRPLPGAASGLRRKFASVPWRRDTLLDAPLVEVFGRQSVQ